MPRSKNRKNLTNTNEPKPTSWEMGMTGWAAVSLRAASKTLGSFNRSCYPIDIKRKPSLLRETRESDTIYIVKVKGNSPSENKRKNPLPTWLCKTKGALPDFVSRSLAFVAKQTLFGVFGGVVVQAYSCGQCSETARNRSRWGAFRSSCGACVRGWHPLVI